MAGSGLKLDNKIPLMLVFSLGAVLVGGIASFSNLPALAKETLDMAKHNAKEVSKNSREIAVLKANSTYTMALLERIDKRVGEFRKELRQDRRR